MDGYCVGRINACVDISTTLKVLIGLLSYLTCTCSLDIWVGDIIDNFVFSIYDVFNLLLGFDIFRLFLPELNLG